jgi:phage-related protein
VLSAAEAGSELQDMSDKTGISTQRLQELKFIGNQTGVSLDTITGAQARLIRSMASAQDETGAQAEAFKALGVSVTDSNGNLRDSQAVFADLVDALGGIDNAAERDALAMQIFGKSAQELNPLIKLGAEGMAEMTQQAHDLGAVMSEDAVAALDEFDDMLSGLQDGVKGTLGTLATAFLPVFQKLASVFQEQVLPVIQRFVAIVSSNLAPVIQQIVDLIGVFASGDIRGGLAQLLGADNADAIINLASIVRDFIQNTLIPFFTTHAGEISSSLQSIIGVIISVATIVTELAIAWVQAWIRIHEMTSSVWEFLRPVFEVLGNWLSVVIPAAVQFLTNTWTGVLLPALQTVWGFIEGSLFPLFQALAEFINAVFNLVLRALAGLWQNVLLPALQAVHGFLEANVFPIFRTIGDYLSNTFKPILDGLATFLRNNLVPAFAGISNAIAIAIDWIRSMAEAINNLSLPDWLTPGSPTPWELGLIGINKAMRELNQHIPQMAIGLHGVGLAGASVGAGTQTIGSQSVQNDQFQFFAPVIVNGDTSPSGFGSALKGKRF